MKKNKIKNKKILMQKYLYDNKSKKIKHNLDKAYININKLWHDQLEIGNTRYNLISGDILALSFKYKKLLNILDIGCGYGAFPNYLNKFKKIKAQGIDVSSHAIELGKKKYKFKNINYGNINNLNKKFKNKFDVITIIGVFWFMLENFNNCYNSLAKILKKNGIVYFQINIPRDNNIFKKKIKDKLNLYNFLKKFFIIESFIYYEQEKLVKKKLQIIQDSFIVKCKLR